MPTQVLSLEEELALIKTGNRRDLPGGGTKGKAKKVSPNEKATQGQIGGRSNRGRSTSGPHYTCTEAETAAGT